MDARDKVTLGMERKSLVMSEEERRSTAYHECGHALMAWLLPGSDPVDKISIVPRGRALGITSYVPKEERYSRSKEDLLRTLAMMMGGRAAEHLVFKHYTTGAANDIERATALARKMVCELGMSENLGPLTFGKKEEMVFLGREIATPQGLLRADRRAHRRGGAEPGGGRLPAGPLPARAERGQAPPARRHAARARGAWTATR